MKAKLNSRARKEYEFYLESDLDMIGNTIGAPNPPDPNGKSAWECWYAKDTHGQILPCREPELLNKAFRSKASWNLQVQMWAESFNDYTLQQEEFVDYCHGLPLWIFEATLQQACKLAKSNPRIGYAPRFMRLGKVHGQWWPPYLDDFDPSI